MDAGAVARFLRAHPPFDALDEPALEKVAAAARVADHPAGALIMDGFARVGEDLSVVVSGQVELFSTPTGEADEVLGPGCVFGFLSLLSGVAVGPRAVALDPVRAVHVPRDVAAAVFSSPAGVRFLAHDLAGPSRLPRFRTVDAYVVTAPVLGEPSTTVAQAARTMTARSRGYLAVPLPDGGFGLVTDAVLRERVLAAGRPADTAVADVMITPTTVTAGTPVAEVLPLLAAERLDQVLVVDAAGHLMGAVDAQDFLASPAATGVLLRDRIADAGDVDEVVALAGRMPALVADLVREGRDASEVTALYSVVLDAVQRRVVTLEIDAHADLDEAAFTWLSLGSNARREPVPSSDLDSAVVFAPTVDGRRAGAYREAFGRAADVLRRAGLFVDAHGATAARPLMSRTSAQWRRAAQEWLAHPLEGQGMVLASLLLDARPILGEPGTSAVQEVFADVRDHPGTMRLLIRESLSHRARLRSMRDVLAGRGGTFDLKAHALRPIVEIARWAALSVSSPELTTQARLAAASGSMLLPDEQGRTLIEVFGVLQRIRLRQQLAQVARGDRATDVVWMARLPPLDRSLVAQSVREIAAVQKRLANLVAFTYPDEWGERVAPR